MKKLLVALAAALVLSVPVFASTDYFASDGMVLQRMNGNSPWYTMTFTDFDANNPVYYYKIMINSDIPQYYIYGISETQNSKFVVTGTNVDPNASSTYTCSETFGTFYRGGPLGAFGTSNYSTPDIAIFANSVTDAEIQQAFATFLEGGTVTGVQSSFTVPAGNVLYFKVSSAQDVNLVANMPVLSNIIGAPWSAGVQFGEAAALPSSSTIFPLLSQSDISFAKSGTDTNLLGQTKIGLSSKHCISGQYYALYCPFHYGDFIAWGTGSSNYESGNAGIIGASVKITGSFSEIRIYPLSQRVSDNVLGDVSLISGSDDGYSSYFDGTIDENGNVTWFDESGNVSTPSVGGQNYVPDDVSTESVVQQIKSILNNIVSEIKSLFSFGYDAINSLVGIMQDFVTGFSQLYTWLPTEVYTALVSAIIVAIVIGVFKVFL